MSWIFSKVFFSSSGLTLTVISGDGCGPLHVPHACFYPMQVKVGIFNIAASYKTLLRSVISKSTSDNVSMKFFSVG